MKAFTTGRDYLTIDASDDELEPEDLSWFKNTYECSCGTSWVDYWSCGCDDECPSSRFDELWAALALLMHGQDHEGWGCIGTNGRPERIRIWMSGKPACFEAFDATIRAYVVVRNHYKSITQHTSYWIIDRNGYKPAQVISVTNRGT